MAQRPSFDLRKLSLASKILLVVGLVYLINLFLPWFRLCGAATTFCLSVSGINGIGILNLLLILALLTWEGLALAGVDIKMNFPKAYVTLGLAGGLLLFTLLRVLIKPAFGPTWFIFAWIGLLLALGVAYGAYMRYQEARTGLPAAGAPGSYPPETYPPGYQQPPAGYQQPPAGYQQPPAGQPGTYPQQPPPGQAPPTG